MIELFSFTLICAFGSNFPSIEANFAAGALGNLAWGTTRPQIVGPLLDSVFHGINNVFCSLLGPRFLVLFGEENNCPNDYAPHTFHSYENFCEWLKKGGPQLQDCVSTVVSDHIVINGIIDTKGHIGQCCNIPSIYPKSKVGGQIGDGLAYGQLPDNGNVLVNKVLYGAFNTANDLVCSLLGPRFLHIILTTNECPSDILLFKSNGFNTLPSFCEYFNSCSPHIQKCLNDAVGRMLISISGTGEEVFKECDFLLGTCCAHYPAKKPEISSAADKFTIVNI